MCLTIVFDHFVGLVIKGLIKTVKNQMFTRVRIKENILVVFVITKAAGLQPTFEKLSIITG